MLLLKEEKDKTSSELAEYSHTAQHMMADFKRAAEQQAYVHTTEIESLRYQLGTSERLSNEQVDTIKLLCDEFSFC